ncbi:hypothetical protein L873DRAFT_1849421 [Choiromyces venosus 120613-1]|uniref:Tc1-like transposase DDE domain-containing protein n=1 Tax=Choiromyces venosus 120613-1 TaxID=1336337 RepID=A0A3N4IXZ5_9PEZI|nr:hypothetical protein L873DRAFT_1849421 [Choiromyces venosus 120613-1]
MPIDLKTGKQRQVTEEERVRLVDKDPSASLSKITVRSGLNITPWTAERYLQKEGYWEDEDTRYLVPTTQKVGTRTVEIQAPFWAAITYGSHTPLIAIRKRTPEECTSDQDCLEMNTAQYAYEILEAYLIPFVHILPGVPEDHETIEDGLSVHTSVLARKCRREYGLNVWHMLKVRLRKRMASPEKQPRNVNELVEATQDEWEKLDWRRMDKMIESMRKRIQKAIKVQGGHTKY